MLETPHVVTGIAIASVTGNPLIAFPLAIASHFFLDMVPHWNPHLNTDLKKYGRVSNKNVALVVLDSFLALGIGLFFAYRSLPDTMMALAVLAGCFGGVLPDLAEAPHYFLKFRHPVMDKFINWQKSIQNDTSPIPGIISQILTILVGLWVIGRATGFN